MFDSFVFIIWLGLNIVLAVWPFLLITTREPGGGLGKFEGIFYVVYLAYYCILLPIAFIAYYLE